MDNISLWRSIGSERCVWGDINLGQLVYQFGGTALGNSGATIDHKVIIQSISLPTGRHRECDSGVPMIAVRTTLMLKRNDNHKYRISLSTSDIIVTNVL